jgi:hypothetical protein
VFFKAIPDLFNPLRGNRRPLKKGQANDVESPSPGIHRTDFGLNLDTGCAGLATFGLDGLQIVGPNVQRSTQKRQKSETKRSTIDPKSMKMGSRGLPGAARGPRTPRSGQEDREKLDPRKIDRPFWAPKSTRNRQEFKKWVPEFRAFFDRVPKPILERFGVENGAQK